MSKSITASFVITQGQKSTLEQWAKEDDRTLSATLRKILEREAQRRAQEEANRKQQK